MKNRKRTLTGIIAVVLVIALASTVIPASFVQAATTVVRFDPAASTLSIGQTVTIHIRIDDVAGLAGDEVHILYNPSILEVQDADPNQTGVQITIGSFLYPDFIALHSVDPVQGKIDFSVLQLPPRPAVSGSGVLASITFKAIGNGTSPLTFSSVLLSDSNANPIPASLQNGQVTVSGSSAPTPTPGPGSPTPTPTPGYPTPTPGPGYPTPTPLPSGNILGYHSVRYRETLFCIGRAYTINPWAIASQNNISYPYHLRIGQVLAIPNVPWTNITYGPVCPRQFDGGTTPPTPVPTPTPPSGCRTTYVVRPGDTLSSIAWRYGTTVWAIAARNNIANPNLIFPGQTLCIP